MFENKRTFINRTKRIFKKPERIFLYLLAKTKALYPDKLYLKLLFQLRMKKRLNLRNPVSYSEKLQWLKLYYHNPEHTRMVDKALAKEFAAETIGQQYVIPLFGIWDNFDEIDFDKLPDQFVLKTTHGCGGIIICKNKAELDIPRARAEINKSLTQNYYKIGREWPYKNIHPKILAEKFMVDESGTELKDYKFFCFDGEPKALYVATDRGIDTRFDFFDIEFNRLPFLNGHENAVKPIIKPKNYEKMVELAGKLSKDIPHVRVDFYNVDGQIYFGEMTFFHWGGIVPFKPEEWDYTFGSWLKLPEKIF